MSGIYKHSLETKIEAIALAKAKMEASLTLILLAQKFFRRNSCKMRQGQWVSGTMTMMHQISFDAAQATARKLAYGYIEKYYIQKSMLLKARKTCRAALTIQRHWRTYAAETRSYGQIILKQLHKKTKQAIKRITSKSKKNGSLKKLDQLFVYNAREYLQDTISLDDHRIELLARYIQIELVLRSIQWTVSVR